LNFRPLEKEKRVAKGLHQAKNIAMLPKDGTQPSPLRSGRQLVAFGFYLLSALLMTLGAWVAVTQVARLLRWTKADAEVLRSEVYSVALDSHGKSLWRAAVTIRYMAEGRLVVTSIDRGFESGNWSWMEYWTRQYPSGSHRKILFNPADPQEADLDGEWSLASFSTPIGFALVAAVLWWSSRRLRRLAPHALVPRPPAAL
jgi:hypothetical protein